MLHIREIRKARGMTMKQLGEKVGLTEAAIGLYETGKREPNHEILLRISEELGCTVMDLFFGIKKSATEDGDGREDDLSEAIAKADDRQKELIKRILGLSAERVSAILLLTQEPQDGQ